MRVVCIIQARTGSTRLPNKVFLELAGAPMLVRVIQRLKTCQLLDEIVIATTTQDRDLPIVTLAKEQGVGCYRGDEEDVLARYMGAAEEAKAQVIVRVTSDCPLIDPQTVDGAVRFFLANSYDYVRAGVVTGFPRGLDTEVFTYEALAKAHKESRERPAREHVTYYFYQNPGLFKVGSYAAPPSLSYPEWRLCVDEEMDIRLMREIYDRLYRQDHILEIQEVVRLLQRNPQLVDINKDVCQKTV